ncbi:nitroreductase [Alcaligenaceae bacterium]|nr:nitroreductase [Alcaligenaceae bacterium]
MNGPVLVDARDMEILERLYAQRFSCRAFLPESVPPEIIRRILSLAQRTASWCNSQPWQVVILSGDSLKRLGQAMLQAADAPAEVPDFAWPTEYRGVYLTRRRECGLALYVSVGIERGNRPAAEQQRLENFRFFGAPHVAMITTDHALGTYGAIDCGAYVTSFITAAGALGVASIPQAALVSRPQLMRDHLGLGEDRRLVCGISFGYADERHPANGFRTTRETLDQVVTFLG